jgi:hypothetical protein
MIAELSRVLMGRDPKMLQLVRTHFRLSDLLAIKSRLIGTGYIGGKAVGMLLARNILLRDHTFDWRRHLEAHDSFFIGSDVFYAFIVHNGLWKILMRPKKRCGRFLRGGRTAGGHSTRKFSGGNPGGTAADARHSPQPLLITWRRDPAQALGRCIPGRR